MINSNINKKILKLSVYGGKMGGKGREEIFWKREKQFLKIKISSFMAKKNEI